MTAPAPASDKVKLTIDGVEVEVARGTSVLEAAKVAGVLVPHYCYHPGIPSVPAVCRMCLVEIEKAPKLAPSCATLATEGMVVKTQSGPAKEARQGVLELLLINHPLDCPICDQAGECELQDYTYAEGRAQGRYADYAKRYNPVEDFGDDVLYVPNRCVLCTRCVRFMDEVAQEPVLNVSERGDRAFIGIIEDQKLDHAWSGNVVDLCPVGSLISKDFLHKARAWDLDKTPSICPGCTQGCSMSIETRDNQVLRLRPRPNDQVNKYFMCDYGRMNYPWMNRTDRIEVPLVRDGDRLVPVDWDAALERAAQLLREGNGGTVALASAGASNEALEALMKLAPGARAAFRVAEGEEAPLPGVPDLALRKERAANVYGALAAGLTRDWAGAVKAAMSAKLVIALDEPLDGVMIGGPLLYVGTVLPEAARLTARVVLPSANMAEEDGSFTNLKGLVQGYWQAKAAPGMARPAAWILAELAAAVGAGARA
jgi:NADH-quinone oxidoreductase subunit G